MRKLFPILIGLFLMAIAPRAYGEAKSCCNIETGEFLAIPKAECNLKPDHISYPPADPEDAMKAMVCFQGVNKKAQEALGGMGLPIPPTIGEMPDLQNLGPGQFMTPVNTEPQPNCCNTQTGSFIGIMPADQCLAEADHYPDLPEYLQQTQICRPSSSGGTWDIEDYEDNIPNGGMERWDNSNTPENFASFGLPPSVAASAAAQGFDMQTVFKSPDAHTGNYSARLKNFDMNAAIRNLGVPIPIQLPNAGTPAGFQTCPGDCPLKTGQASGGGMVLKETILPIDEAKSHICGAYKGWMAPNDELAVSVALAKGDTIIGGTNAASEQSRFSENASDWKTFTLPFAMRSGKIENADGVNISAQMQARNLIETMQAGGLPPAVNEKSEIYVDSFHFCEPIGMTAYHPTVIAIVDDKAVPNDEEESLGVQTFVNLDNDDADVHYDFADKDGTEADNELVRLNFTIPRDAQGMAELKVSGGKIVKLWDDKNKKEPFQLDKGPVEVDVFFEGGIIDATRKKDIWVEALLPSKTPSDVKFEFIFTSREAPDEPSIDIVTLTALGIEKIEFEGQENSFDDSNELDEDPNYELSKDEETSYRVFPGRRYSGDKPEDEPRNNVSVKATLNVAPVRPIELWFISVDVDDPSAIDDEVDNKSDAEDNRGRNPGPRGNFPETGKDHISVEFEDITATFDFQVTMSPGDNFRIVGGADIKYLMTLENDDGAIPHNILTQPLWIYDPAMMGQDKHPRELRIREHDKYVSDILTVWRKLHLEIDTLGPVEKHVVTAKITAVKDGGYYETRDADDVLIKTQSQQWVTLDTNLFRSLPETSQSYREGLVNNYRWGWMTLGNTRFDTNGSTARESGGDDIRILLKDKHSPLGPEDYGKTITLIDDDRLEDGDDLTALQTERLEPAFAPAYVYPTTENVPNPTTTIPFQLHFTDDTPEYLKSVFKKGFDGWVYHDESDFWLVYVLNAYQGKLNEDGDGSKPDGSGEGGLSGMTDGTPDIGLNAFGIVVFQESGRETATAYAKADFGKGWQMQDVAPHEIAHLFGGQHEGKGLMSYDDAKGDEFEPSTLAKIRTREHP